MVLQSMLASSHKESRAAVMVALIAQGLPIDQVVHGTDVALPEMEQPSFVDLCADRSASESPERRAEEVAASRARLRARNDAARAAPKRKVKRTTADAGAAAHDAAGAVTAGQELQEEAAGAAAVAAAGAAAAFPLESWAGRHQGVAAGRITGVQQGQQAFVLASQPSAERTLGRERLQAMAAPQPLPRAAGAVPRVQDADQQLHDAHKGGANYMHEVSQGL